MTTSELLTSLEMSSTAMLIECEIIHTKWTRMYVLCVEWQPMSYFDGFALTVVKREYVYSYGFRRDVRWRCIQRVIFILNILECDSLNVVVYSSEMLRECNPMTFDGFSVLRIKTLCFVDIFITSAFLALIRLAFDENATQIQCQLNVWFRSSAMEMILFN